MANFFTDNEDLQFYLNDSRLSRITELREKGYSEGEAYPFAPENFEDAKDINWPDMNWVPEKNLTQSRKDAKDFQFDG